MKIMLLFRNFCNYFNNRISNLSRINAQNKSRPTKIPKNLKKSKSKKGRIIKQQKTSKKKKGSRQLRKGRNLSAEKLKLGKIIT
jgi:hypothetical protein